MKQENLDTLRDALIGKKVTCIRTHGGHGMILELSFQDGTKLDIATYDDGKIHPVDEFYIGLNGKEL